MNEELFNDANWLIGAIEMALAGRKDGRQQCPLRGRFRK